NGNTSTAARTASYCRHGIRSDETGIGKVGAIGRGIDEGDLRISLRDTREAKEAATMQIGFQAGIGVGGLVTESTQRRHAGTKAISGVSFRHHIHAVLHIL